MISVTGPNVRIDAATLLRQSRRLKSPRLVILAAQREQMSPDSDSDEWSDGDKPSPLPPTPPPLPPTPPPLPPHETTASKRIIDESNDDRAELLEFCTIEKSLAQKHINPRVSSVMRRKKCFENLITALNTRSSSIRHSTFLTDKS